MSVGTAVTPVGSRGADQPLPGAPTRSSLVDQDEHVRGRRDDGDVASIVKNSTGAQAGQRFRVAGRTLVDVLTRSRGGWILTASTTDSTLVSAPDVWSYTTDAAAGKAKLAHHDYTYRNSVRKAVHSPVLSATWIDNG